MVVWQDIVYFPCLQHPSTAFNSGEPAGKYSAFIWSRFLCRYSFASLDLCWVALSTNRINLLNFFFTCPGYAIREWLSNLSCCLNSCLPPSADNTPKTMVLLWEPVTVTTGLFSFWIHLLFPGKIESRIKVDSSSTRAFQPFLRAIKVFCTLF